MDTGSTNELVAGLIRHSDAGSVYTSLLYTDRLIEAGALASIGTAGDSYDNAMAEQLSGCIRPRWFGLKDHGATSSTLSSLPLTMSGGSTTAGYRVRSATTRRSNTNRSITLNKNPASRSLPDKKPSKDPVRFSCCIVAGPMDCCNRPGYCY